MTPATLRRAPSDDGSKHFAPFGIDRLSLADFDYVEEEWIATGEEDGNSYATTVLVRRPRDVGRFSGMVIAEPLHVHGIAPIWLYSSPYIMRSGHGWVEIASQKVALDTHVKPSDSERYGSLHIEGPETPDFDLQPSFDDPNQRAVFWAELERRNRASSSILAQVGAALRADGGPFDDRPLDRLVLAGHSQTGSVTTRYILEAHQSQRLPDGSPAFDGFFPSGMPADAFGGCDVPIVQVVSEGDVCRPDYAFIPGNEGRRYRRDDSDERGDRFRLYELAAVPHMGTRYSPYDDVQLWQELFPGSNIPGTRMNSLPHNELFNMGLDHLVRWVAEGITPPRAERLEVRPDGFFVTDEHGNTRGGVRCVQLDVPRAQYFPSPLNGDGTPTGLTIGGEQPFDAATLQRLYPDPSDYTERFERRLAELIREGWLLADDADEMRREAASVDLH